MKKKVLKKLALLIAISLIVGICWFANALCGNPVSKFLAESAADAYLEEHFPDTDYYIKEVGFNFKDTNYYAHVRSDSSIDTQFSLYINLFGKVYWDTYESMLNGSITSTRLYQEYRELTDQIFENPSFKYKSDIQFGSLEIYPQEAIDDPMVTDIPDYAIVQQDLILDHIYDIRELGRQAGRLVIYVDNEELTFQNAAKILLEIRAEFDNANIPFRAIDFRMRTDGEYINFDNFLYEDIYEEGLVDRIAAAHAELEAYYAEQDALK